MTNASNSVVVLDDYRDSETNLVLLPEATYEATYAGHQCLRIFRASKVRVDFKLLAHPGITLSRWYRAAFERGRISAKGSSDIVREISAVLGKRVRQDRIPMSELKNRIVRVEVHTVRRDRGQRDLAKVNEYSVIERVLGSAE